MRPERLGTLVLLLGLACAGCSSGGAPSSALPTADAGDLEGGSSSDPDGPLDAPRAQLELPHPGGPYAIGTQVRELVDVSRTDPQAPDPTTKRRLMVQLYYPTDAVETGHARSYLSVQEADWVAEVAADLGAPSLPPGWQRQVLQHGRDSVPPASGVARFPVVLFSHGLGCLRTFYVSLIEDLVSRGFVVVAISHTYDSGVVVFPDGTVAPLDSIWRSAAPPDDASAARWEGFFDLLDAHIAVWVADARFVLDRITQIDRSDPQNLLTHRLDLGHVGMFGHSYGGAATAELCALDDRIKAGIDLDGPLFSPARRSGGRSIPTPFMMLLNEAHGLAQDGTLQNAYWQLRDAGYAVQIAGSRHGTFTDLPLVLDWLDGPHTGTDVLGTIDPLRAASIVDAYTLAFFEKFLEGADEPLLDGPPPYPEVTLERR